jgi:hypothetical protein
MKFYVGQRVACYCKTRMTGTIVSCFLNTYNHEELFTVELDKKYWQEIDDWYAKNAHFHPKQLRKLSPRVDKCVDKTWDVKIPDEILHSQKEFHQEIKSISEIHSDINRMIKAVQEIPEAHGEIRMILPGGAEFTIPAKNPHLLIEKDAEELDHD